MFGFELLYHIGIQSSWGKCRMRGNYETRRYGALFIVMLFFAVICGSVLVELIHVWVPIVYAAVSVCTFIAYAVDKSAAKAGRWRTPESTLQMLSLLGGVARGVIGATVLAT